MQHVLPTPRTSLTAGAAAMSDKAEKISTLEWRRDHLRLIDQTKLPARVEYRCCQNLEHVAEAITSMRVRGAPAIGVAAAFGMVLAAREMQHLAPRHLRTTLKDAADRLKKTRPTAVNLSWAVDRMLSVLDHHPSNTGKEIFDYLLREAEAIVAEDLIVNRNIGSWGQGLILPAASVLTICNAGSLATAGYGTALGVLRAAREAGRSFQVFACETRPNMQGARLTTWELLREGIEVTLVADFAAGHLMRCRKVDLVLVGADRIASNGDTANKIGTYSLAVLARAHGIPFYVAAPSSTFDFSLQDGSQIPLEERPREDLCCVNGVPVAPEEVEVYNPAFDVTPGRLISGIITEYGVISGEALRDSAAWLERAKGGE